jgi:hypothetical protein
MNVCFWRIIPSPKKVMYQFNEQGMLKTLPKQETYLTNLMLRRGLLSAGDSIYKSSNASITGPARSFLSIKLRTAQQ